MRATTIAMCSSKMASQHWAESIRSCHGLINRTSLQVALMVMVRQGMAAISAQIASRSHRGETLASAPAMFSHTLVRPQRPSSEFLAQFNRKSRLRTWVVLQGRVTTMP